MSPSAWAVYTQQMMSDAGYLNGSKELWLTFYKQILRVLANTILDVRLQTMGMTDQQALDLMMKETYQEKEEATAKLQRAQLSSCQLPTYFVGWKGSGVPGLIRLCIAKVNREIYFIRRGIQVGYSLMFLIETSK